MSMSSQSNNTTIKKGGIMIILASYELKDMGDPIKETQCYLFFKKGKIAKHTIPGPRRDHTIEEFRKLLDFKKYKIINKTIQ